MEEQNEMQPWTMFNVKIKNNQGQVIERKASDNTDLLQWMEMKEATSSILRVDIDKAKNMSLAEAQARAFQQSWIQLKLLLEDSLGLIENEQESEEPEESEESDVGDVEQMPKPAGMPKPTPTPQQNEVFEPDVEEQFTNQENQIIRDKVPNKGFFENKQNTVSSDEKIVL